MTLPESFTDNGPADRNFRALDERTLKAPFLAHAYAPATADLTLTTTPQDIAGCEVTLDTTGTFEVIGAFSFNISVTGVGSCIGILDVDGVDEAEFALYDTSGTGLATPAQTWQIEVDSGAVLKLQASKFINAGTAAASHPHTTLSVKQIG